MKNKDGHKNDRGIIFAILVSFIVHLFLFLSIIFLPDSLSSKTDSKERIIVTRLVALGVPRSEKIMPRISGEARETPGEIVINTENQEATEKTVKKEEKRKEDEFNKKLLSSISKVRKMVDARDNSPPVGDPNGSPFGDSTEGQQGDLYLTEIYNRIKSNYIIPEIITDKQRKDLRAIVIIYIDHTGKLIKYEFEKKSGNTHFDNALINAINRSSPFKAPPKERTKMYKTDGIGINFSIE
ncbi:MAG: TonB C-terminal domain-containing protein [Deltaproteobacteria bacterium]|nr:TonB C-terminal domain-containing protein [Deltaproteobacteria bacterium]